MGNLLHQRIRSRAVRFPGDGAGQKAAAAPEVAEVPEATEVPEVAEVPEVMDSTTPTEALPADSAPPLPAPAGEEAEPDGGPESPSGHPEPARPPQAPAPAPTRQGQPARQRLLAQRVAGHRGAGGLDYPGYPDLRTRIRERLLQRMDGRRWLNPTDKPALAAVRREVESLLQQEPDLPPELHDRLLDRLLDDIAGFGPIQPLIDDPAVTEIMVNRFDDVWSEREGRLAPETEVRFGSDQEVRELCERIALPLRRRIDEAHPILDGRLPDGSRVNAILAPVALGGTCLTIRKFAPALTVERLMHLGTLTPEVAEFLQACVLARVSILVSGGTSSGKTSLLNALSSFIPADERIVTIEDAAELKLQQPHVVRLETRPPNVEGRGEITIRDLVRTALRMRPDRIVVGECRGPEALDMVQANNTGHEGGFSTLHANSPADAVYRLETMVLMADAGLPVPAIRRQIASAFDLVVHMSRMRDGTRRIAAIAEVVGCQGDEVQLQEIFVYRPQAGGLVATGVEPERLMRRWGWMGIRPPSLPQGGTLRQRRPGKGADVT